MVWVYVGVGDVGVWTVYMWCGCLGRVGVLAYVCMCVWIDGVGLWSMWVNGVCGLMGCVGYVGGWCGHVVVFVFLWWLYGWCGCVCFCGGVGLYIYG